MIKKFIVRAGALCAAVLTLNLALLSGNGGSVPEWVLYYLFALAWLALCGAVCLIKELRA